MEKISELLGDMRFDEAAELGLLMVQSGDVSGFQSEIMKGMRLIEKKYNDGEFFIADLIVAGALMRDIYALIKDSPFLKNDAVSGRVVIGTISGDIHNIGKDIFADALRYRGFKIIDLGVDVPIDGFIKAAARYRPDILAVSSCIDTNFSNTKALVRRLRGGEGAPEMKIIVGGSVVDERFVKIDGVDFMSRDFQKSVAFCVDLMKVRQGGMANAGV